MVQGALQALDTRNVDEALRFAPEDAEAEIRAVFDKALEAREAGPAAREVADAYFAETVVRLHRTGEGAPYTGLRPVGLDVGPVIPVAERAIETESVDELVNLLSEVLHHETKRRFDHVMDLKERSDRGLPELREYTGAMLGLQVWCHKLGSAMKSVAPEGHEEHHG